MATGHRESQDDGPTPLCVIDYSDSFRDAHDRFRGAMEREDMSEEALELTAEVIQHNSANYTAWWYRRRLLEALKADLREELEVFTTQWGEASPKNYQVWFHRRWLIDLLGSAGLRELEITEDLLTGGDQKVYNAWSHRQWILQKFGNWDREWNFVNQLLAEDVHNNSAWNHREFLIRALGVQDGEMEFTANALRRMPMNESAWNYALALARRFPCHWDDVNALCQEILGVRDHCRFALYAQAEFFLHREQPEEAEVNFRNLADGDPVRRKYWAWRADAAKAHVASAPGVAARV